MVKSKDVVALWRRYGVEAACDAVEPFQRAVTHKSADGAANYETLEHLGDAVVALCATKYLFERYPSEGEGFLTRMRMKLVSSPFLAQMCLDVGIAYWIRSASLEGGNSAAPSVSLCEDVFEAFVGATFQALGFEPTYEWYRGVLEEHVDLPSVVMQLQSSRERMMAACAEVTGREPTVSTIRGRDGMWTSTVANCDGACLASASSTSRQMAESAAYDDAWKAILTMRGKGS